MKKFILFVFSLIIGFAVFCGLYVKADSVITTEPGASVRTTGEYQGLKFQASVDTLEGSTEHGFFLAIGEHSFSDMQTAINTGADTVGGYKLLKKAASGTDEEFTVTIYGIDNTNYDTDITAVAYVYNGSTYTLGEVRTRNIAEVSLTALQDGNNAELVKTVVNYSYYAVNFSTSLKYYIAAGSIYENNVDKIKDAFLADWKAYDDSIDISSLHNAFAYGNKDKLLAFALADNNISTGARKWHWLWGYLSNYNAYKKELVDLWNDEASPVLDDGHTILYQTFNFFANKSWKGEYEPESSPNSREIDFWNHPEYYSQIGTYNITLEANHRDASTTYVLKGGTYTLPNYDNVLKDYYTVTGWNDGSTTKTSGASYTLSATKTFKPVYSAIPYTVTYMDESSDISSSFASSYKSFNVESGAITLPTYEKPGYIFEGWYDNDELTGDAITTIPAGSHGDKTFYAKMSAGSIASITFAMNDGSGDTIVKEKTIGQSLNETRVRGAYIFNGWYDNPSGTGVAITETPSVDTTLYAKWTPMTVDIIKTKFLADINASAKKNGYIADNIVATNFYSTFSERFMNVTGAAVEGVYPKNGLMASDSELLEEYGWLLEYIGHIMGNKAYGNTALVAFGLTSENDSNLVSSSWSYCDKTITNSVHNFLTGTGEQLHSGSSSKAVPADFSSDSAYDGLLAAAASANFSYVDLD